MKVRRFVYIPAQGQPVEFTLPEDKWADETALPYFEELIDSTLFERHAAVWNGERRRLYFDERGMGKRPNNAATEAAREASRQDYESARKAGQTDTSRAAFELNLERMVHIAGDAFIPLDVELRPSAQPYMFANMSQDTLLTLSHDVLGLPEDQVYASFEEAQRTTLEAMGRLPLPRLDYVDFMEALRNGRVLDIRGNDRKHVRLPRHALYQFNQPVYDFGGIMTPGHSEYLGEEVLDEMMDVVSDFDSFDVPWPHPDVAFMFSMELEGEVRTTKIVRINKNSDLEVYIGDQATGRWGMVRAFGDPLFDGPLDAAKAGLIMARNAAWVLKAWELSAVVDTIKEAPTARLTQVNKKRRLLAEPLLPVTRVIHLTEEYVVRMREKVRVARPYGPTREVGQHERDLKEMVITRTYKSGKTIHYTRKAQKVIVNAGKPPAKTTKGTTPIKMVPSITVVTA